MSFDMSNFVIIGKWIIEFGKQFFQSFQFEFVGYTVNAWGLLIGLSILSMFGWFLSKIFN